MYCRKCLTEYRDGFFECADCRVPLAPGPPPQVTAAPQPEAIAGLRLHPPNNGDLALVTVLETADRFGLSLATAALEDAGIEYLVVGRSARFNAGIPHTFGFGQSGFYDGPCTIQVAPEFEAKARELLEPFQKPLPAADIDGGPEQDR